MATDEFLPKLLRRNVPPQLTLDHVSPATRLLEKRRQKIEVQEALEAQKADFARREEQFQRREQIIKKKDLELQENLIRFNKFLQENDTKRTRAEKKFVEEERKKNEHTQAIEQYKQQLAELRVEHDQLQSLYEKNQKYLNYLDTTCENTVRSTVFRVCQKVNRLLHLAFMAHGLGQIDAVQDVISHASLRRTRHIWESIPKMIQNTFELGPNWIRSESRTKVK